MGTILFVVYKKTKYLLKFKVLLDPTILYFLVGRYPKMLVVNK